MISLLMSNSPGAFMMKSRRSKCPKAARRCTNDLKPQTWVVLVHMTQQFFRGCFVVFAPSPGWDVSLAVVGRMQRCRVVLHNFAVRGVACCAALLIPDVHS